VLVKQARLFRNGCNALLSLKFNGWSQRRTPLFGWASSSHPRAVHGLWRSARRAGAQAMSTKNTPA